MDDLTITPVSINQSDLNSGTEKESNGNSDSPAAEGAVVDEKKVSDLLIGWMNVLPTTNVIERARLLKLAADVDDADEVVVCNLILFKDILDTQLKHSLSNADRRFDKRLKSIDREYEKKRSACEKQYQNEKKILVENTVKTLRENRGPTLMEELYRKSVDTAVAQAGEPRKRRRNRTVVTSTPFIVYELDEKDAEADVEELRRRTAEQSANKLLDCLIEDSARRMNAQLNK